MCAVRLLRPSARFAVAIWGEVILSVGNAVRLGLLVVAVRFQDINTVTGMAPLNRNITFTGLVN